MSRASRVEMPVTCMAVLGSISRGLTIQRMRLSGVFVAAPPRYTRRGDALEIRPDLPAGTCDRRNGVAAGASVDAAQDPAVDGILVGDDLDLAGRQVDADMTVHRVVEVRRHGQVRPSSVAV